MSSFNSKFSEDIFNAKYRHEGAETWEQLSRTLVEDVCRDVLPRDEKDRLFEIIRDMKFIPGGRYLYYAGRPLKAFNNCLSGDTKLLTTDGMRRMDSFTDGEEIEVYSPIAKRFLPATMHQHGEQMLMKITFAPPRGRSKKRWVVKATADHKWPTLNRGVVEDLQVGDLIGFADVDLDLDGDAIIHGLVFADGSVGQQLTGHFAHQLRLCGDKGRWASFLEANGHGITYPKFAGGDPVAYIRSARDLKRLPIGESPEYIASFIRGWVALDGTKTGSQMIHSINREAIEFFVEHAHLAGYVVTGEIRETNGVTNFATEGRKTLYGVNFQFVRRAQPIKVVSIEPIGIHPVWCPFEPIHNRIVIDHGIDTFQCFLLRSEEDTREDWANLSWKAESCLTLGGGIGNDYSRYRPKGSKLSRTGGVASGPVSKMRMINEIGREVMQGGSRRSAIYASLDATHQDIMEFIHAKDWHNMVVEGTGGLTVADLKRADFNYPAPLDMTNISPNYKTDWLIHYLDTGDVGEVFLENCRQAMKTGEPGFSFNFFGKENETLRNACTEVTSEDDSDVCNLGSVNMARIETRREFGEVVYLASRFLYCGTLVSELPYEKVYAVREKNRRLGLGLMGVHEWLIQRGYRYEVVPELHEWLHTYRAMSLVGANRLADSLGLNRPKGYRAIAPTGTIGILAGTTTGIEPLYAVAYKRRYLRNGTQWHYQYVIDAAAQGLIERYGVDPDKIESALDLAEDYERRIKFQADVQDYVDQGISSTINMPAWGTELNNETRVMDFAQTLAKYAPRLRGLTIYPDGARGGQPLVRCSYEEAKANLGREFQESVETHDICIIGGKGGVCGI